MKTSGIIGLCAVAMSMFACSTGSDPGAVGTSEGAATTAATAVIVCTGSDAQVATTKTGIVTLVKIGPLYKVASGQAKDLALSADAKTGTWKSTSLSCAVASAVDAPGWIAAGQMADYASSITSLAGSIFEEEAEGDDDRAKRASEDSASGYAVFAIESANASKVDLGTKVAKSDGALPANDDDSDVIYDDDNGYGGLSAAYDLGGGDDWGEYFQGASDGVSIADSLGDTKATFSAYEKSKAFDGLVKTAGSSVVEITVGGWTFFAPSDFSK